MLCPSCHTDNAAGAKFCGECGAALSRACPSCGMAHAATAKFCTECGTALAPSSSAAAVPAPTVPAPAATPMVSRTRRPDQAERRQITVVFCDLVSSTELSAKLDPEDLREILRDFQRAASQAIDRHDGYIAQHLGDGILVYFGYPRAHEDDPRRAVSAGLEIIEAVRGLGAGAPGTFQLSVRIGIHTGPVVVGAIGASDTVEQLAIGETPNLAARLQGTAAPDTVVISDSTARRVRQAFDLDEREPSLMKGFSAPIRNYRVIGPRRLRAGHADVDATPFVGREAEASALRTLWDRAKEGTGRSVMVRGEPGVGKSRLCALLSDWLNTDTERELRAACSTYTTHTAMRPIVDLVAQLAGWQDEDPPRARVDALVRATTDAGLSSDNTVPFLLAFMGLPDDGGRFVLPDLTPQARTQRTLGALADLFVGTARRSTLAIAIEDLHWVDETTLDMLGVLIERAATSPMLLVLTCRQQFEAPWQVDTEIPLHRLPREAVERIVLHTSGGRVLPPDVLQQIVLKADGNPLFVEELTRMVLESGLLVEGEDGALRASGGPLPPVAIPSTLHDSLMARLDRLSPPHRALVQLCATIGRRFSYELIQEIVRSFEEDMQNELRRLTDGELLYQRGVPPRSVFVFRHALIQDAAYGSLLHRTRAIYHGRVADVLLARFPDTPREVLAHHLTEAGRRREAIAKWLEAGQAALSAFALGDTLAHLQRGLSLVAQQAPGPEMVDAELGLRVLLNVPLMLTQGFASPEVEANCTRMLALCESGASGAQSEFAALWGLWTFSIVGGDHVRAHQMGGRLLDLAERTGAGAIALAGHTATGAALLLRGRFDEARRELEAGLAVYDRAAHAPLALLFGQDAGAMCASFLVWTHAWSGRDTLAAERAEQALRMSDELNQPGTRAFVETVLAAWCCCTNQHARAERHADRVIALAAEQGMPNWDAQGRIMRGWAMSGGDRAEEAAENIRNGIGLLTAMGAYTTMTVYWEAQAEAELARGRVDAAEEAVTSALAYMDRSDERVNEAALHALRARIALARGDARDEREVRSHFDRAITIARAQRAEGLERRITNAMRSAGLTVG